MTTGNLSISYVFYIYIILKGMPEYFMLLNIYSNLLLANHFCHLMTDMKLIVDETLPKQVLVVF